MRISYRFTSGAAIASLALPITETFLPAAPQRPRPVPLEPGEVNWAPCSVWFQLDPMDRLIALVWFGAYIVFAFQGLRNRSAPRWLAVAGVLPCPCGPNPIGGESQPSAIAGAASS